MFYVFSGDSKIATVPSNNIPRIGEKLELNPAYSWDIAEIKGDFLVTDIKRSYNLPTSKYEFGEHICVYVVEL